jgi:DNA invertase Pin-like site-specific DNA recombinase
VRSAPQVSTRALPGAESGYNGSVVRSAAYLRVSTRQQGWELQRAAVEKAAAARGDQIAEFFEEKRSGSSRERPELVRLMAAIRAGGFGRLYVFRLDRLTRLGIRDTLQILDEITAAGCNVVTVTDGFELQGPAAGVIIAVMAWAAQVEGLAKAERISAARARIEAEGGSWGRPRRVDPLTIAAARKMRDKDKLPVRVIAQRLKVPKTTLLRALHGRGRYASKKG